MPTLSAQIDLPEGFNQATAIRWCGPVKTCSVRANTTGQECIAEWVQSEQVSPELFESVYHQWQSNSIRQPARSLRQLYLSVEDRKLFRVIESPRGRPIKDLLFRQSFDLVDSLRVAVSLTKCLGSYHRSSRLFVWFSGENIYIDHRNQVQLRDSPLGSVHTNQDLPLQPIFDMSYLSPESSGSLSRDMKPASDLYAVGAMLFTLLTGRTPIIADNASDYLNQQLCAEAPRLRELHLKIPKAVDDLVARLLRRDPCDRYQSAGAVLYDLKQIAAMENGKRKRQNFVIGTRDVRSTLAETSVVGFDEELNTIQRLLDDIVSGPSRVQIISAADANCRQAILDEVELRAKAISIPVFRGAATTINNPKPLQSLQSVMSTIGNLLTSDSELSNRVAATTHSHAGVISPLFPDIQHLWPATVDRNGPDTYGSQRAAAAIEELITSIARHRHGAVILFDDIDQADELTRKVINSLAQGVEHGKIPFLGCVIAGRSTQILQLTPSSPAIIAGPLPNDCLVMHLCSSAGKISESILQAIIGSADGNPWMASAILGRLIDTGSITSSKSGWIANGSLSDALHGDQTIGELLKRQVKSLSSSSLEILSIAATIGQSFDLAMLSHLAKNPYANVLKVITDALGRKLLWRDARPSVFRFGNEQVHKHLCTYLTTDARRDIHARAAAYLQIHAPTNVYDLAYHFDAAGAGDFALDYSLQAAKMARQCFSLTVAKEQLSIAKRWLHLGNNHTAFTVYSDLGEILLLAGEYDEASSHLQQAIELAQTPQEHAKAHQQIGELAFKRGDFVEAANRYRQALAATGIRVPRHRITMLLSATGQSLIQIGHILLPKKWVARKGIPSELDALRLQLLSRLSHVYCFSRNRLWTVGNHLRLLNLAESFASPSVLATAYSQHGLAMSLLCWFSRANRYANRSIELSKDHSDLWGQGQSYHHLGVVQLAECRFHETIEKASRAVDLLKQAGDFREMNMATYQVANALLQIGRLNEAVATASQMYYSGREIGDLQATGISLDVWARAEPGSLPLNLVKDEAKRFRPDAQTNAQSQLAYAVCLLHRGQIDEAITTLQAAIDRCRQAGLINVYISPCYAWLATAMRMRLETTQCIDIKLLRDRFAQASDAVKRAIKVSKRFPADQAHCYRELAHHFAMLGNITDADKAIRKSLESAKRYIQPIEEYDSLVALDALLRRDDSTRGELSPAMQARLQELRELYRKDIATVESKEHHAMNVSLADRFVTVLQSGRRIAKALTPDSVYLEAIEAAKRLLRGQYVDALKIVKRNGLTTFEPIEFDRCERNRNARIASNDKLIRAVVARGYSVCRDDSIGAFPSFAKSVIATPVAFRGECVAVLLISHDELKGLFGKDEIRIADFISTLAGAALENADGFANLQSMNDTLEQRVEERTQAAEERARQLAQSNSQLRETEEQLREAIAITNLANQAKSRFLATISHEIRTPLNGILGMTHLAKKASDQDRCASYLDIVEESGQALLTLINDLLDFSKLEAGKMELERIALNLRDLVDEVVRLMSPSAWQNHVDITCDWEPQVPRMIFGDPSRLRQVVVNLVGNAIKFTNNGSIVLSIKAVQSEPTPRLVIAVKDTGIGIPADKLEKVFESFSQCDSSTTRKYGGTGLGLAICKELVEMMDGSIRLESVLGVGSTFTIDLPMEVVDESTVEQLASESRCCPVINDRWTNAPLSTKSQVQPSRILVAEDGEINQEVIRGILEMQGCEVTIAQDGCQALELASQESFDICFMDIDMPNMDGIEATVQIRSIESCSNRSHLPIIAMTAHSGDQIWGSCQAAGMDDYLPKPIQPDTLMQAIKRHVQRQSLFQQAVENDH
jgi:signal transduction histidine kinase/CheY-like chemotaxis protein/tetratricopeptide (TPR) repeat protein/serine/threonine protein kinase